MATRMVYRDPLGDTPGTWAKWLRELREASGVYVIRTRRSKLVLYVGESHTGRLYDTITRHFQDWSSGQDRIEYDRHRVEIGVFVMPKSRAYDHQVELIKRLRPRDNVVHAAEPPRNPDEFKD